MFKDNRPENEQHKLMKAYSQGNYKPELVLNSLSRYVQKNGKAHIMPNYIFTNWLYEKASKQEKIHGGKFDKFNETIDSFLNTALSYGVQKDMKKLDIDPGKVIHVCYTKRNKAIGKDFDFNFELN